MINQGAFAAITPIRPDKIEELRAYLKGVGGTVDQPECPIKFREFASVHFMRWVILDPAHDHTGVDLAPCLVLSTNFDLPLEDHLRELVEKNQEQVRFIYGHCEGFDVRSTNPRSYLLKHQVPYAAFYVGTHGRDVRMIRDEQFLRDEIQKLLDQPQFARDKTPRQIREAIQDHVKQRPDLSWALKSDSAASWRRYFLGGKYLANAAFAVVAFLLLATIIGSAFAGPAWFGLPWWLLPAVEIGFLASVVLALLSIIVLIEKREQEQGSSSIRRGRSMPSPTKSHPMRGRIIFAKSCRRGSPGPRRCSSFWFSSMSTRRGLRLKIRENRGARSSPPSTRRRRCASRPSPLIRRRRWNSPKTSPSLPGTAFPNIARWAASIVPARSHIGRFPFSDMTETAFAAKNRMERRVRTIRRRSSHLAFAVASRQSLVAMRGPGRYHAPVVAWLFDDLVLGAFMTPAQKTTAARKKRGAGAKTAPASSRVASGKK